MNFYYKLLQTVCELNEKINKWNQKKNSMQKLIKNIRKKIKKENI